VLAICLLGGVLGAVLVLQLWPRARALAQAGITARAAKAEDEWTWPRTLQVYPAHPGDPVKLVRIIKGGQEIVPGKYELPQISGDHFMTPNPMDDWLRDASFVLENQSPKTVVSVGISVILPARQTGVDCSTANKGAEKWCEAHPHWCDGGCPVLIQKTVSWGRIATETLRGLKARYLAEGRRVSPYVEEGVPLEGKGLLRLESGWEMPVSVAGRGDSWLTVTDPRKGFSDSMNGILYQEGIEEARGGQPCLERRNSKNGCAFSEVSKFNIGLDVVHFEDGTIWGNYGYGYALPRSDGIFERVGVRNFPGLVTSPGGTN
jgi:hypothetical protein